MNCVVAALILLQWKNLSHDEFFRQLKFNVALRLGMGLKDFDEQPFVPRTFYNFKNRLRSYESQTGTHLIAQVFTRLSSSQLKDLRIKTNIQRTDTVLINSNITAHSRLSLLVEVLCRLHRILSESDRIRHEVWFKPYLKGGEKYVYSICTDGYAGQLEYLGAIYHSIHQDLSATYADEPVFQIFQRAYQEHFKVVEDEAAKVPIEVRPVEELTSNCLQSPDDLEATFRKKKDNPIRVM